MLDRALFLFRRDLRLADNTGLIEAARRAREVIPVFVFDTHVLSRFEGHSMRLAFLIESLVQLEDAISRAGGSLRVFVGDPAAVIGDLMTRENIPLVMASRDYTPFAMRRDERILSASNQSFVAVPDALLNEPESVLKQDGTPYQVFTPYHRAAQSLPVAGPQSESEVTFGNVQWGHTLRDALALVAPGVRAGDSPTRAGREGALEALEHALSLDDYERSRDVPSEAGTSRLSAHLRFGT
ncbi:MAG: deoxyribodipyrimidine photo-lyase, partial [Pseudomonadales bacterium]|nr:deoxyribodipyrimidine photo-lyase [Pseudomonadales bacterium]